ncbi:MAG: hypothetical protein SGPRY_011417, partial [Prymnesium sp.]
FPLDAMDEASEVEELQQLLSKDASSLRESNVTTARFSRWAAAEERRQLADGVRSQVDTWRAQRQHQLERHKAYGAKLKLQMREQITRDRSVVDEHKQRNISQAQAVKAQLEALRQAKAISRAQWEERGRLLAKKDMEQRARIKAARGEGSRIVSELTAKAKAEEAALNEALQRKRREILEANRREVAEIRMQTDDQVTEASKKAVQEQRKSQALTTRLASQAWVSERKQVYQILVQTREVRSLLKGIVMPLQKEEDHISKAKANKEEVEASRARVRRAQSYFGIS